MTTPEIFNWAVMSLSILVLLYLGFKAKNLANEEGEAGFLIAGRSLTPFVGAATIVATGFSGWGFIGSPGAAYQYGSIEVLANFMFAPAIVLGILYFARYMQKLAHSMGSNTIPEFIAQRHAEDGLGRRLLQGTSAIITVVFLLVFLTGQVKALGLISANWLGLSVTQGALLMLLVIIFYTMLGGLAAVAWTDTLMVLGMAFAAVLISLQMFSDMDLGELLQKLNRMAPEHVNPSTAMPYGHWQGSVFLVLPYAFMFAAVLPYMAVRFLAFKPNTDFRRVALFATPLAILLSLIPLVGLYMRVQVPDLSDADRAMPVYLNTFMNPYLGSLITLFILFAMQSTANSLLHTISSAVSHDLRYALFYDRQLSSKQMLYINRAAIFILGMIAMVMMLYAPPALLLWFGYLGTGTLLATLVGPAFIGTFWKGNVYGAFFSMLTGCFVSAYCLIKTDSGLVIGPLYGVGCASIVYLVLSYATKGKTRKIKVEPSLGS